MQITPSIESYFSRGITGLTHNPNNNWTIQLEGDVGIINDDSNLELVPLSDNMGFWGVDWEGGILKFGLRDPNGNIIARVDQPFNQTKYRLIDPSFQREAFTPIGQSGFDPGTPPEPVERVASGPENPHMVNGMATEEEGNNGNEGKEEKIKTTRSRKGKSSRTTD